MLDYVPHLKMYVSSNPPPPVFALRAWVEFTPTLPRVLCEILSVDQNIIQVQPLNNPLTFFQSRAQIHSVHRASITTGEVIHFYGEPKPC
jgi:hypothetical protein